MIQALRDFFLRPYRALQPPPESASALQVGYLSLAAAFGLFMVYGLGDPDIPDVVLFVAAGGFGVLGGVTGALAQFAALWFVERGAIFALWAALVVRIVTLIRLEPGTVESWGRVLTVAAIGFFLVPRFNSIRGADQDPKK